MKNQKKMKNEKLYRESWSLFPTGVSVIYSVDVFINQQTGSKITALKNGHIPGAVNLDWLDVMDQDNNLKLKELTDLRIQLQELGITDNKNIITHCLSHHRSGLTYIVGKLLKLNI